MNTTLRLLELFFPNPFHQPRWHSNYYDKNATATERLLIGKDANDHYETVTNNQVVYQSTFSGKK